MKDYRYKGYTFRATNTMTSGRGNSFKCLYEIDGLKPRGKRPFLTTIDQCKDYINDYLERNAVIYYWYDHLLLRKNGDAKKVQKAIAAHDLETFCQIRDKYQPNDEDLCYFPDVAYCGGTEIDITTPKGFSRITVSEYECG